ARAVCSRHTLGDIRIALPAYDVKVVESIVLLTIDYILERGDLREVALQATEDFFDPLHLIVSDLQYNHHLTCIRGPDGECPQKSYLFAQVKKRNVVGDGLILRGQSYGIGSIRLKVTFNHIKHLVIL